MKKRIATVLALLILAGSLAGCVEVYDPFDGGYYGHGGEHGGYRHGGHERHGGEDD